MIKTTRYYDICGKEINDFDKFYELSLPHTDGINLIGIIKSDVCSECIIKLDRKIKELKHPTRKRPD